MEWPLLISAKWSCFILNQVLWKYLERYQSYRADTISILKITKGNNSAKNVDGANVVNLCMSSGHALYLCQVSWNNLKRHQSYRVNTISIRKITKGNNSAKNAGGATVVNLCTSSDHALYFYQVLWNYLKRYQSYGVKVPITSLVYGYTKVLAHNLNSKKTSGAAIGWKWMLSLCYYFFLLNLVFEYVRSERDII